MDASFQTLAAASELREFTVALLAKRAGVKPTTVRTVLNRHRHLFEQHAAVSGRRGGQPHIWRVREAARPELQAIVSGIATRFDEDQQSLLLPQDKRDLNLVEAGRLRLSPGNPELAGAEDLEAFAPHLAARELLPHMVRRLLQMTPGVTGISVRAGDGIGLPGIDGRAESRVGSGYVPAGMSAWELGTNEDARDKAQADFRSRTRDPGDLDPATTTFVAVSMRRFPDKDSWAERRRANGPWRDVRALDADDLYGWLEETPFVHIWVSEQLGLRPLEVATLERWWETWLSQTEPPTPGRLLLAGRRRLARELRNALKGQAQAVGVQAASREEAMAFSAAALLIDDDDYGYTAQDTSLAGTLVVSTTGEWARLTASQRRSVLIPDFDDVDIASALRNGHPVAMPMGAGDDRTRARIVLPPIDQEEAREVFRHAASSAELDEAYRAAAHAHRSLVSFRRRQAINPTYRTPRWAQSPVADILAPLVLAGSWEAERASDQQVVADVAGRRYAEIERELSRPSAQDDPLFFRAGDRWQLTSPVDAWSFLGPCLTRADLERWRVHAVRVLTEEDPALELPPEERHLAAVRGIRREYSPALRKGLAQGAALLGSDVRDVRPNRNPRSNDAAGLVFELLGRDLEPRRWSALEDVLPALAEAAPSEFLRSAAAGLAGSSPLRALFTDADSTAVWETRSAHTGLLWALELLCWSERYVADACDVLARLAEVDPGGKLANRPEASLRRVLLPWYPQTAAPLQERTAIVAGILERRSTVGWRLLLGLLPQHFDSSHPNYRPLFREWRSVATDVTLGERLEATRCLVDVALSHARTRPGLWPEFIEGLPTLPAGDLERSLGVLAEIDPHTVLDHDRLETWRTLINLVATHRQSPSAAWALPDPVLRRFEDIADRWEPIAAPERHSRLFDWHPDLVGTAKSDYAAYEDALSEVRRQVIAALLQTDHGDGLDRLVADAPVPGLVGLTLAEVAGDDLDSRIVAALGQGEPWRGVASGWVMRMADLYGLNWVGRMIRRASQLPEDARVALYLALPNAPRTWDAVDRESRAVADEFWKNTRTMTVQPDHAVALAHRLLEHRRAWSAIDLLGFQSQRSGVKIPVELIERSLLAAATGETDDTHAGGSLDYVVGVLLDQLEQGQASRDRMTLLEWLYFNPLQHTRRPKALFGALANDPGFFVELVCTAFRASGEPLTANPDPSHIARVRQAYSVLQAWRRPPGLSDDGSVDGAILDDWVMEARRLLANANRMSIGDECIGGVLSGAPTGADGIWPAEPVRDLLEALGSRSFAQGLAIGKLNARGVTTRGVFDGGRQEDALADQYEDWSKQVMARWPETGRLLREISDSYRTWARREDAESEEWSNES